MGREYNLRIVSLYFLTKTLTVQDECVRTDIFYYFSQKVKIIKMEIKMPKCVRCRKRKTIPGFCRKCYMEVYGLKKQDIVEKSMDELICRKWHLTIVERDIDYTNEIKNSIIKDGLINPIIISDNNVILVGHHRYFIGKELGWKSIPCIEVKGDINKFIEGGANNLFIVKIDGKLVASLFEIREILPFLDGWISGTPFWRTSHLSLEAFTGLGAQNDPEHWDEREQRRITRLNGKRNLSGKY